MNEGMKFSQVYIDKGASISDSIRMRNRIEAMYWEMLTEHSDALVPIIHRETGAKVPFIYNSYSLPKFFEQCEIRDLLDSITIIFQHLLCIDRVWGKSSYATVWHKFVSRVFSEENVGYRLDKEGGVHFYIDEEFERIRSTLISSLTSQPAVKDFVERAHSFLDQDPPDTGSAVKSMFEALEILYKHIVNAVGKDRLNSKGVQEKLKPILQKSLSSDPVASKAVDHIMDSFCDWIDAGHMYRHGQKLEEPSPPPLDYAVLFISLGSSYLRYLLPLAK